MSIETIFNSPDKWSSEYLTADGYKTHYIEAGKYNEEGLVLVHGGSCEIGMGNYRWYPNILPLAENFHVYAVDEIGHGFSDPPRDLSTLGHVRYRADHVIAFIEELGLGPVNIAGQSQGGWIVAYIAITRPDLVKKLILIDSASVSGSAIQSDKNQGLEGEMEVDGKVIKSGTGELPYFKEVFEPGSMMPKAGLTDTREGLRKYISIFVYDKSAVTEDWLDHLLESSKLWNAIYMEHKGKKYWEEKGLSGHQEMLNIEGRHIREHVHKINVPTLVIWGKNSNKGLDAGVTMYKNIENAQMHILDKANHFLWLDQPHQFNSVVTWFLKDQA